MVCFAAACSISAAASAAQTQVTISMQAPPPAPRIGGAPVVGVRPATPFLYTIAATGTRPLTFAASGLPAGLALDAGTGRISGSLAAAGDFTVMLTASNVSGSASRPLRIVAGDTLALTPPMGWNSYDSFDDSVTEAEVLAQAAYLRDNLQQTGWDTVVVDFRWYDPDAPQSDQNQAATNLNLVTDDNGRLLPAPNRFPSAAGDVGFKALADQVHAMGLKFGIHIMRGIPRKSVQGNTPIANSTYTANAAGDATSACPWNSDMYGVRGAPGQAWYDSIFQQYAAWGVDYVKVDDITRNVAPVQYHQEEVEQIASAIRKSGRSIVLSLSPGQTPTSAATHVSMFANLWRISDDFWDRWSVLGDPTNTDASSFALSERWRQAGSGGPGHWPDADMLPLGYLGPRCPVDGNHATRFTRNEQVMMMSLWAVASSPMMLGANLTEIQARADAWTTALLTNDEVIAVGQDAAGDKGRLVVRQGTTEVWAKTLAGGATAVALFNRGEDDVQVSATWSQLGLTGLRTIRNLWTRADLPQSADTQVSMAVPFHGAALVLLAPAAPPSDAGAPDGPDGGTGDGGDDADGQGGADGSAPPDAGTATDAGGGGAPAKTVCGCRTEEGSGAMGVAFAIMLALVASRPHRRARRGPRPRGARVPAGGERR